MKRILKRKHLSHERTKGSVDHAVPWSEEKRHFYGHRPSLEAGPWSFCGVFALPSCFKRALVDAAVTLPPCQRSVPPSWLTGLSLQSFKVSLNCHFYKALCSCCFIRSPRLGRVTLRTGSCGVGLFCGTGHRPKAAFLGGPQSWHVVARSPDRAAQRWKARLFASNRIQVALA